MSYANPDIIIVGNPVGVDVAIQSLQQRLYSGLPWLTKSFGRAWEHKELVDGKSVRVPKVYIGHGEYHNVLPNDFLTAQSFIAVRGPEQWDDFSKFSENNLSRSLSIVVWVNLKAINPGKNYIYLEELKSDVENILKTDPYVQSIDEYIDERAEDVFDAYDLRSVGYGVDDAATQYLMYPYAGFRFNVTVGYKEANACQPLGVDGIIPIQQQYDIEIEAVGGETSITLPSLVGKKVRFTRMGIRQYTIGGGSFWSFNSATGRIDYFPAADPGEVMGIEVIGPQVPEAEDITFTATQGQTVFQDSRMIGRQIRVTRMGVLTLDYSFNITTGVLTIPAADAGEIIGVEVYG